MFALITRIVASRVSCNDSQRLRLLWREARKQARLKEGDFLELGVFRGGSAILLAEALRQVRSPYPLYLLDSWEGLPLPGEEDRGTIVRGGEFSDAREEDVRVLLRRLKLERRCRVHAGLFRDTLPLIAGPFSFVHIDCDLFESVRESLLYLLPRMTAKGLMVIDDYGKEQERRFPGVKRAVDFCIRGTPWSVCPLGGERDQSVKLVRT